MLTESLASARLFGMTTYFRTQSADRDVTELLRPEYQFSHAWNGNPAHTRVGVSVCSDLEDLALYLASHVGNGIPVREDWVLVELEGDRIEGAKVVDPEFESLIIPTRIVRVWEAGTEFMNMIKKADEFLDSFTYTPDWED